MGGDGSSATELEVTQRFLRRGWLLENFQLFLRESKYHRDHDELEDLPFVKLWDLDEEEGSGCVADS